MQLAGTRWVCRACGYVADSLPLVSRHVVEYQHNTGRLGA